MDDKDYHYETKTEKAITDLKKEAESEKYFGDLELEIEELNNKMKKSKNNDIDKFKTEISEVIELEIATRYYYQKGKVEASLKHDIELSEAVTLLNDLEKYNAILRGDSIP